MKKPFLKILSNQNFLKIWLSQVFSLVSAATLTFVLIGKIFSQTQSSVAVSLYLFFYYLPTFILGPFVGVFIDSWSRKTILFYSNLIQAVLVLIFLLVSKKLWPLYTLGFLYSLGDEFYNPTVGASIPSLVKKKDLTAANSLFFITTQTSIIFGSLLGGLILKFFANPNDVYLIVCATLVFASLLVINLPAKLLEGQKKLRLDLTKPKEFFKSLETGYLFIKSEPMVLFPIVLLAGLQVLIGMSLILLPSLAKMIRLAYADSSILLIIPAAAGALTGSWFLNHQAGRTRKNIFIFTGFSILGFSLLTLPFLAHVFLYPTFLAIFVGLTVGIGYVFVYIPLQTLIQENTPFKVRGRVFGALSTLITLAAVIPMLITTTLADIVGLEPVLFLIGAGLLVLTFLARRNKEAIIAFNGK